MATNPFGFGPMGLPSKASQAEDPATKKSRIDALAVKTQVPANVLLAFDERGENVEAKATEIGAWLQGGRKMEEVVPADVMGRAYDIADALYPRTPEPAPAPKEPSKIRDFGNVLGSSLIKGAESIYQGAAVASDLIGNGGTSLNPETSAVGNVFRALASERGEASKRFMAAVSPETLQAMADSAPDGDPLDPSTWTLGKSPSALGYAMLATDVFGSFATTVAAGVLAGPVGAAAAGGLQGGGAASQTAERTIAEMATTPHPDGGMVIDHESSYFKFLIKEGVPREEAIRRTTIAAQQAAFTMTMPVSALGGAATSKIVSPGHGLLAGQGVAARVAGTGALSALEEGSQEAVESMATKAGINTGAGTDLSLTEGTVGDFILGALGGGPVGAASGIPAQQTRDDGSVAGEAGASETTPPGGGALVPAVNPNEGISPLGLPGQEGGAAGLPTPPLGPLSEIAAVSPDLTPQPEAAPRFPDQKPGKEVRLVDPETGVIHDAVVLGETPEGIAVRIAGGEVVIDPATFDAARLAAGDADTEAAGKPKKVKRAPKNAVQPSERPAPPVTSDESGFDAAAEALRQQGFYDLPADSLGEQAKAGTAPKRPADAPKTLTPEEALKRAQMVEDTAARGGWTPRLKKKHAEFMAIAGGANAQGQETADDVGAGNPGDGGKLPDLREGGQGTQEVVRDGRPATNASGQSVQPDMVSDGDAAGASAQVVPVANSSSDIAADAGKRGTALADAPDSAFNGDLESSLGAVFFAEDGADSAPLRNLGFTDEEVSALERAGLATNGQMSRKQWSAWMDERSLRLSGGRKKPRPQSNPITTKPDDRIQPDMLGGNPTTETEMATKERRRKEWGRFLAIVEGGKSSDDSSLEGRDVLIRGTRVIIRAKNGAGSDQDYRLDTEGMDRDTVAARVRGALQELDRRAPLDIPPPQASAAPVQAPAAVSPPQVAGATEAEPTEVDSVILKAGTLDRGRVNLSKWPEGWKATYDYHIQGLTSGTGGVNGFFPTKEAAIAAGKKVIADGLRSIAEDRGGSSATPAHIAKAKKIVKWAAGDAGVGTNGTTPGQAPSVQATTGLLSVLSAEKQARAAELAKKLADKARNQTSSGLDPEYITLGGELVKLYLEAGVKKFGQMLRDFAEQTGLTLKQAQEPMRAAYNHVRDNMEIEGESIDGMDDARAVLEEAKKAIQGDTPPPPERPNDTETQVVTNETQEALNSTGVDQSALAVQPMRDQEPKNRVLSHAKMFGDSKAAQTLRTEPFKSLSRNDQGVVLSHVVSSFDDKQVFGAVIKAIPVDVVNMLIGKEITPEGLARDPSVLTGRLSIPSDVAIPQPVVAFINELVAATKGDLAVPGAKDAGLDTGAGVVDLSGDTDTTGGAVSGDYWHGEFLGSSGSVHVNASPAQKEAENYQVISADWRGLKLSLESPKGTMRRGFKDDGSVAWEVKMPAHYGRILGTKGADGDHVDFYMGPYPQEDMVYVIDQRDIDTGEFDEIKVMIGFKNQKAAVNTYFAGFSDGKGPLRMMAVTPMGATSAALRLQNNPEAWKGSLSGQIEAVKPKAPPAKSASPAANRAFPDFKGKLNGPYWDDRSDDGRFNAEKNAFHDAGLSFFRAAAKILKDNGWTEAMPRAQRGQKAKPINPVSSNKAGPAVLGEVSITMMGPDGANGIYAQLGESFSGGNRAQMMWRINQATNPYGSGANQFLDPTGMTPQEFAEKVILAQERYAKKAEAPAAPAPDAINAAQIDGARLTTKEEGRAAGKAWAEAGGQEPFSNDPAMGNAGSDAKGGWTAGFRSVAQADTESLAAWDNIGRDLPDGYTVEVDSVDVFGFRTPRDQYIPWGRTFNKAQDPQAHSRDVERMLTEIDRRDRQKVDRNFFDQGPGEVDAKAFAKMGADAFAAGGPRRTPIDLLDRTPQAVLVGDLRTKAYNEAGKAYLSGWDRANLDAPVPDVPSATPPANASQEILPSIDTMGKAIPPEAQRMIDKLVGVWIKIAEAQMADEFGKAMGMGSATIDGMRALEGMLGQDMADHISEQFDAIYTARKDEIKKARPQGQGDSIAAPKPAKLPAPSAKENADEQPGDQGRDQVSMDFGGAEDGVDQAGERPAGLGGDGSGEGNQDAAGGNAGNEPSGGVERDPGRVSDAPAEPRVGEAPPNFTITDDFALGAGTDGQKLEGNLAALRLVKTLEAENRFATPEEQATLARWVGWGGLKTVFDEKHAGTTSQWGRAQAELKSILTRTEYFDAMRSTADAHYTSRTVVDAMWQAMRNFGFTGGRALEPTIGSGNFLGLQPADLGLKTEWFASEIDSMTGRMAKHLYPRATVFDGMGFQDAPFRRATFDIAIGNPPFGGDSSRVGNAKMHPDLGRMKVHNFVIAKTGQLLREGGIMGMVVTHRFLDAMDAEARDVLAPNYHFLGAVRLPNTAFKANAGTEVTTDIVFFQKRRAGDEAGDTSWLDVGAPGPNGTTMNAWFAANPDMILGRPAMDGTMYAGGRKGEGEFTVHDDGRDLAASLKEAVGKIKASLPSREQALEDAVTAPRTVSTLSYGTMALTPDGRIFRGDVGADGGAVAEEITAETFWRDNAAAQFDLVESLRPFAEGKRDLGIEASQKARNAAVTLGLMDLAGDPVSVATKFEQEMADAIPSLLFGTASKAQRDAYAAYAKRVESKRLGSDGFDRLKSILDLRGRVKALIRAERNDEPPMEQIRGGLRQAYQAFRNTFGFLNNSKNEAILQGDVGPEMALEVKYKAANKEGRAESAEEAPILSKRVIFPHKLPENMDSVADAMHVSMQERGYVDPLLIADLTNRPSADVIAELTGGEKPMAFKNPATSRFEPSEIYLSGNIAEKIDRAKTARAFDHIPHLSAAMPPPKTQEQITPSIRSMWIPRDIFEDFLRTLGYSRASVSIMEKVGMVSVDYTGDASTEFGQQFKTDRAAPGQIFEHAIRGKIPVIFDTYRENGSEKRVKNEEATKEAVAAYERMSAEFPNWAYANPMRAAKIVDAFNKTVNVVTPRKYEGTRYLRTVGTSPLVQLRNSQKNGAWRMIQDKMVLLHHVVGAGKTMTGIVGVMERKRMGLTRKAIVVVPNHLTGQWGKEWLELYPAANILVPTEKDFDPANRSKLINRIATGDFDAVIIGHSQLVKIDNDPDIVTSYVEEEMDALNDAMQEQKRSGDSKRTVSQMGQKIQKLREKLSKLNDTLAERRGAGLLSWKELGVDYMVLDESQEFKNLEYATSATQLVGMNDPVGSQKAFDLLMKIRGLQSMQNGGVTFMTGTPISNSLVEIYSVMKYLIPESMDSMGIKHFDAWKAAFIQDESRFEYTASMQLKERNVMSGMVNLGPLAELYRSFSDIVMRPDVERMYREQMEAQNAAEKDASKHVSTRFPTPKVLGGKRRIMLAPPTDRMQEFTRYLVTRMAGIKNAPDKKEYAKTDNPLWVLTDARKASVDIRTIDPSIGREEGSKVTRSAAEVFRIWKASVERRGTQMVFSDMSTPSKNAEKDAKAILKAAYGKIGLKKDVLARRIAKDEGRTYSARWSDLVGDIEAMISSPATTDAARDALNLWTTSPEVVDAAAAMFTADTGFSFYDDLKTMLVEKGIPEAEIAFIHDYGTTAKKKDLFDAVNEGKIRVLIGSTMKMGAGTNAQRRLVALHHIDAPWRPSDMEQREGRIIRQGNLFYEQDPDGFEVEIIAYSTEKTADVVQWQVLERKAKAIETFLGAATDSLQEEGGDADQYAEFMAQSTGKKVFLQKMQVEKDLIKARGAISSALRSRAEAKRFIEGYDAEQAHYSARKKEYRRVTADLFPDGHSDYMADWRGKIEAYRAERDRIEAENEKIRSLNVGKPRKEWVKLLDNPNAPQRWSERPTNKWEAKVYDVLTRAFNTKANQSIDLGNGFSIEVVPHPPLMEGAAPAYSVHLVSDALKDTDISLTEGFGVTAKDFRNSDKLLYALDPANILFSADHRANSAAKRLDDHAAMLPKMQALVEKKVDETTVRALEIKLAALSAETRIEEVKYAEESAKLGDNHFAMIDTKGRDLRGDTATKPLTGQFQFTNAGRKYASEWGAPAGTRRIPDTDKWGPVAYFEATDMDSGDAVIIDAVQQPKEGTETEGRWAVENVFERADDGSMEMRDTADGWGEVDPEITEADIMAMTQDLNAELQRTGLVGKANVRVVRELVSFVSGARIYGRHDHGRNGKPNLITIEARRMDEDGIHPKGVMRHEIIHALRSEPLWNRKGGIFTEAEWSALTEAARGEAGIVASVKERYPHLDKPGQVEEMVAELYRLWMDNRDTYTGIERAMLRVEGFLTALANLLRGKGFVSAARVMEQIATGKIGGRGPQGPGGGRRILGASKESDANRKTASDRVRDALGMEMRGGALPGAIRSKFKNLLGSAHWKNPGEFVSNAVTDAMGGDYGTLGLVPGRALFAELGKRLPSAKVYLRLKEEMDAIRNAWHAKSDEVAQEWRKARRADPRANDDLMDLMHRSTLSGVDPSKPDTWKHAMGAAAHDQISRYGDNAPKWAFDVIGQIAAHEKAYAALDERFAALPKAMQDIYRKVRAQYDKMGDDFEKAVLDNIEASMKVAMKRAEKAYRKAVERIRDDGLEGEEKDIALAEAKETLDAVKKRGGWGAKAKISALRKKFESNKLKGPYFPLARFGQFFVTIRNHKGEVVSFSRFEKEAQQLAFIRQKKEDGAVNVQYGVLSDSAKLKGQVDPTFVADIEGMLADSGASDQVMDAIWQRWLETLPDQSIRTSKIHRKGREGWNSDAFRAFGHHMFHGAHQLARLKFGLPLEEALNDADEEAKAALDPNRSGLVVNEMRRRHEFTMNPKGSSAIAAVSGMAFVWYLGATPASAVANLSQTTVIGPGVMASRFKTAGITGSIAAIGKAAKDFAKGKGEAQKSPGITQDEHAAMTEAYRRGTIDKTQAHDLAAVAETGIEYNSTRELWMRRIGWMFHHAERFNREVTFLAAYRLARGEGAAHADAIDAAADTTWTIHFDYQNCVDDQTEILTIDGWKMWNQVKAGDRILSTDDTGMAVEIGVQEVNVFHRPQEIALFEAKGTRRFSMAVTDDHKCVAVKESKSGGKRGFTAPHFVEAKSLDQRHHLLRAPLAPLDRPESIGTDMAALIGWFAAEGWYARNRGAKEKNNVRLEQSLVKNPEHVAEIDGILSRLGPGFSRGVVKQGRHVLWSLSGPLAKAVQAAVPDKLLPWSLLATMSAHEMSALLDAFVKGDGNRKGKNDCITITQKGSTNRQNLEVLQAMATALGKTASIGDSATRDMSWLTMPGNGRIQTTKTAVAHLERKRLSVPMVWCPTTDNGRWIARRNGCVFVTGNTSRPRIMQNDLGKIATIFRNYTVNLAWRMFRDAHQSLSGATKEERAEARMQLVGTTLSMMLHAGIKGTYGYGIIMLLLSMFFPGDSDDIEEWLQDALLMEGDGLGAATWNYAMGAALNGVPGQLLGVDLTDRIGSPNLWFRGSSQDLEGADLYNHYVGEILGPTYGLGYGFFRGASMAFDDPVRAFEAAAPKILRDIVKTGRYAVEGVETMGGDDILESVNPYELLMQASGFTPARVSERFDMNTRLKNKERQITDERKGIHKQAVDAVLAGKPISQSVMDEISDFNRRFPEYPITSDTIRQSAQGRMRAQKNAEFGVTLNPKISTRLRDDLAPSVYN